jgi:hypothetical protein
LSSVLLCSHVGVTNISGEVAAWVLVLKMEVSGSSKMLVTIYKTIWSTPTLRLRGSQSEFTLPVRNVKREKS